MEGERAMERSLKRWICVVCAVLFSAVPLMGVVQAESLWTDNATPMTGLFADHKAHAVGDILTILVSETSSAVRTGSASNSKTASVSKDAGVGTGFKILGGTASAGSSDSFKTAGSLSNSNVVTAKLTVQVTEIKPNGNLVVSGTHVVKQNNEEQTINVTGEVRPEDVTTDNTVSSVYVANAQIKINGKGPINDKERQGILTQIFNFLF